MEWFWGPYEALNTYIGEHMHVIAGAISACVLVILSRDMDKLFKDNVKKQFFAVKTTLFILVCGVGYEVATWVLAEFLIHLHEKIAIGYLIPLLIGLFILIGLGAQRKNFI